MPRRSPPPARPAWLHSPPPRTMLAFNVCRRQHRRLASSARLLPRAPGRLRPVALTRLSSSTSARPLDFTSYFFHNEQWSADAMRPETHHPPSSPPALVPSSSHPYPSLPLTA
ncbi:hypothetical protein HETIRDRAFT_107102, partial [Heterobasidion irregulare TC 32-1]